MPVAMLLIDWDSKIGAVLKAKVPGDFADYYREDLNTEIIRGSNHLCRVPNY
jgi:hypothetical protein